jgi:hypothetical protein
MSTTNTPITFVVIKNGEFPYSDDKLQRMFNFLMDEAGLPRTILHMQEEVEEVVDTKWLGFKKRWNKRIFRRYYFVNHLNKTQGKTFAIARKAFLYGYNLAKGYEKL